MDKKILYLILLGFLALPSVGSAQLTPFCGGNTGTQCVGSIQGIVPAIVSSVWIIFAGLAIICFLFAGIMFLTSQGAPEKLTTARHAVLWGVVGVIVAILAYSAITLVQNALGGGANTCTASGIINSHGVHVSGCCNYTVPGTSISTSVCF